MSGYREYLRAVFLAGLILAAMVSGALEAQGHTSAELDAWAEAWTTQADYSLSGGLLAELADMTERHPWYFNASSSTAPAPRHSAPAPAEAWRSLVAAYFNPGDVDYALAILWCESTGDPGAYNTSSGASGLFQHLARYWADRSTKAGWAGASIMDPEANTAVAAWLAYSGGGWGHWPNCSRL